ncbi:Trihydrophobin [Dactylellina cionopaga]|nr:Trihydrophobin [Dactylellina cionopaga]
MQFFVLIAALSGIAFALPQPALVPRAEVCPSTSNSSPQCCATNVVGGAGLNCVTPTRVPTDGADLKKICSEVGKAANCCALSAAGQAVLCNPTVGAE